MEEVVELKAHLQSPSHVTHTSRETSTRQSTHRPRTHQKMLGSISACEVYLVKVEGGGEKGNGGGEAVVREARMTRTASADATGARASPVQQRLLHAPVHCSLDLGQLVDGRQEQPQGGEVGGDEDGAVAVAQLGVEVLVEATLHGVTAACGGR